MQSDLAAEPDTHRHLIFDQYDQIAAGLPGFPRHRTKNQLVGRTHFPAERLSLSVSVAINLECHPLVRQVHNLR